MVRKKVVAMLLAGGQGSRLSVLTNRMAKPAVPFGGKYRIIDFPLSNCVNSNIDTVGVLTQYEPLELNAYIGTGQAWDLDRNSGGVFVLPPYQSSNSGRWYSGTANAIFQNMAFIDRYDPEYVLILSGDHIYKMDYALMLDYHISKKADLTVIDLHKPNMRPINNITKNVVYAGSKENVRLTMVNGRVLYENGEFYIGEDAEKVYAEADKIIKVIKA